MKAVYSLHVWKHNFLSSSIIGLVLRGEWRKEVKYLHYIDYCSISHWCTRKRVRVIVEAEMEVFGTGACDDMRTECC